MDFETFVLAASTGRLADEPAARGDADALEFRMDLADDPLADLEAYEGELPLIVTNRAREEGGQATSPGRLNKLKAALGYKPVEAVDVDLASVVDGRAESLVERAREEGVSVITSVHDPSGTPPREELRHFVTAGNDRADVTKLAVTAKSVDDVIDLLVITREFTSAGIQVATVAMSSIGRHLQPIAPLYGSRVAYASVSSAGKTAAGQYELGTFRSLLDKLQ